MSRYRVVFRPDARTEAREAYLYLRAENPQAAEDFQRRLDEAVAELAESAHTWRVVRGESRRYLMTQFPYALIYRLCGDVVSVGAVMHNRQRPGYWRNRRF